jgi:hypothetical protein
MLGARIFEFVFHIRTYKNHRINSAYILLASNLGLWQGNPYSQRVGMDIGDHSFIGRCYDLVHIQYSNITSRTNGQSSV